MASAADGWPVWIPLIVGLAPGLVYWLVITGDEKKVKRTPDTIFYYFKHQALPGYTID